ncbi:hypothetical protein KIN20_016147 [Parelaphostrongylus tenuis]|uniref:Uncharacterized protein n=1 Tax=Parelaphostrongylus tenuis TaxID=148309 RepID=A0AAD5MG09_PARTN|nr:hypothetical protein KIN20_016147 [Parelaphostrongylus tenuis]
MATRLAYSVQRSLRKSATHRADNHTVRFEIALNWQRSNITGRDCGTPMRNRIMEIRRIVIELDKPVQFGYVTTDENVADCATRGVNKASSNTTHGGQDLRSLENNSPKTSIVYSA